VDIIHCHNLHGRYFDLRALPWLASSAPLIVTLHDNWPLTGFCAYPFDCQKWRSGCGRCPELACLPKPPHDRTATDWRIKRDIFQRCRVYVAAPSRWMLDRAKTSLLAPAIIDSRVIPNGVDLRVFTAGDQTLARQALGIPEKAWVLLAAAKSLGKNANKDHQTLQQAVAMTSEQLPPGPIILLALGAEGLSPRLGRAEVRCVPFVNEDKALVQYYRAADIFLHSARQEVFGNVLVESMACGTPVIASAVGGVSEILDNEQSLCLYPPGDAPAMATRIRNLLIDGDARRDLALRGIELVHKRYSLETQVTAYLEWYAEILNTSRHPAHQEHAGGRHPFRHRRNMP
jgi:glycosyltransferase involved in cell wall biosynthesis